MPVSAEVLKKVSCDSEFLCAPLVAEPLCQGERGVREREGRPKMGTLMLIKKSFKSLNRLSAIHCDRNEWAPRLKLS